MTERTKPAPAPASPTKMIEKRITHLKAQLEEFKEYKKMLALDGMKPDSDDKERESRIIQELLGLEKDISRLTGVKPSRGNDKPTEPGTKPTRRSDKPTEPGTKPMRRSDKPAGQGTKSPRRSDKPSRKPATGKPARKPK
jgi:hypothetical protein